MSISSYINGICALQVLNDYFIIVIECACDVIKFLNPKLKSHQRFYPHQA